MGRTERVETRLYSKSMPGRRTTRLLFEAVNIGDARLLKRLLKEHPDADLKARDQLSRSLLHANAQHGSMEVTRLLLKAGCELNARDSRGNTPLHVAIRADKIGMARYLIEVGQADVRAYNCKNEHSLHLAAMRSKNGSHVELARLIIKSCINEPYNKVLPWDVIADTALFDAIVRGDDAMVVLLLDVGRANVQTKYGYGHGKMPLHIAASRGRVEMIKQLTKRGADVNVTDDVGRTPLSDALFKLSIAKRRPGRIEERKRAVGMLLESGATLSRPMCQWQGQTLTILEGLFLEDRAMARVIIESAAKSDELRSDGQRALKDSDMWLVKQVPTFEAFYEQGRAEVRKMRSRIIRGTKASFLDVLTGKPEEIACFARNEELLEACEDGRLEESFPVYGQSLRAKLREGQELREIVDEATVALCDALPVRELADPRHPAIRAIMRYLSHENIRFLA